MLVEFRIDPDDLADLIAWLEALPEHPLLLDVLLDELRQAQRTEE